MPRYLQEAAVPLASATHAKRKATMMMTNALLWTRTKTSAPLGTNPRNRIQRRPVVFSVTVCLNLWLQKINMMCVHLTIGLHSHTPRQKYVSTSRHNTETRIAPLGTAAQRAAPLNHFVQQPNIKTSPRPVFDQESGQTGHSQRHNSLSNQ